MVEPHGRKERTVVCLQFLDGSNVVGLFSIKIMPVMKQELVNKVYDVCMVLIIFKMKGKHMIMHNNDIYCNKS